MTEDTGWVPRRQSCNLGPSVLTLSPSGPTISASQGEYSPLASDAYGGSKKGKGRCNFICPACGRRDIIVLRTPTIGEERALQLAVCPGCGERDRNGTIAFWIPAGAVVALPSIVMLLVGAFVFSDSLALMLVSIAAGAVISWLVYKKGARARWRRINNGITFESQRQAQLEYAMGLTKDRPAVE